MIIRIATEGQYELDDGSVSALNELDNEAVAACEADDEERFRQTYGKLVELVRTRGRRLDDHGSNFGGRVPEATGDRFPPQRGAAEDQRRGRVGRRRRHG